MGTLRDRDIRDIMVSVIMLLVVGVLMVYSSTVVLSINKYGSSWYYLTRHLIKVLFSVLVMLIFWRIDYRVLRRLSIPLILGIFVLLVVVLFKEDTSHGAKRWLDLGLIRFQPSELLKLCIIISLADYIERFVDRMGEIKYGLIIPVVVVGIFQLLIILEPDFGTVMSLVIIMVAMLLTGGTRLTHLGLFILCAIPVAVAMVFFSPYRWSRIICFLNPWKEPSGCGFQLIQSFIAFGRGGVFGVGIGQGQQKLYFLPEIHTDFIFSIIGEEFGLLGGISVIVLFCWFFYRGIRVSMRTRDLFSYLLGTGIVVMIAVQTIINIGVTTGMLPTKGLPLPFVSWGGSSLLVNMASVGILLSIASRNFEEEVLSTGRRLRIQEVI